MSIEIWYYDGIFIASYQASDHEKEVEDTMSSCGECHSLVVSLAALYSLLIAA